MPEVSHTLPTPEAPRTPRRVLLLENVHPSAHALFMPPEFVVETVPKALGEAELIARLKGVSILGIRSKTQLTKAVLAGADALMCVGCFCIGTNQVDLKAAHRAGVPVFNAPFSNTRSVAELVIGELVALARQLCDRSAEVHRGQWHKTATGCYELRGKTLGIVGYGHIGSQVGVLAEAMGLRVIAYDIATKMPMGNVSMTAKLSDLLQRADFVTLHVPETASTLQLMGAAQLMQMRRGSYLLNISRGSVVDLNALSQAIASKHLGGAAIDVYPSEPESNAEAFSSPLQSLPNVILTPHIGGSTMEAQENIGREVATSLTRYIDSGSTQGAVNFPQVHLEAQQGLYRVLHVHHNVPGVLRDVNRIVTEAGANIHAQVLSTDNDLGYLLMDLDNDVAEQVAESLYTLPTTVRTRVL